MGLVDDERSGCPTGRGRIGPWGGNRQCRCLEARFAGGACVVSAMTRREPDLGRHRVYQGPSAIEVEIRWPVGAQPVAHAPIDTPHPFTAAAHQVALEPAVEHERDPIGAGRVDANLEAVRVGAVHGLIMPGTASCEGIEADATRSGSVFGR